MEDVIKTISIIIICAAMAIVGGVAGCFVGTIMGPVKTLKYLNLKVHKPHKNQEARDQI